MSVLGKLQEMCFVLLLLTSVNEIDGFLVRVCDVGCGVNSRLTHQFCTIDCVPMGDIAVEFSI